MSLPVSPFTSLMTNESSPYDKIETNEYHPTLSSQSFSLTVAEYFAGIGLVRMGLEPLGWKVIFANDINRRKYEMYSAFFGSAGDHYIVDDIFNIDAKDVPFALLATCSFPCIDLSLAGNMNGMAGEHSSAFWGFIRTLRDQGDDGPALVLVENVPGWLSSNNGEDFRITVEAINKLGYACDVFILDARGFTPQSRKRVFLVGSKIRQPLRELEPLFERPRSLLSNRLKKALADNADLAWTYIDIPDPPHLLEDGLSEIVEKLQEDDMRWWPESDVRRHLAMMSELHRERVEKLKANGNTSYRTFYRRRRKGEQRAEVRKDDIAGCLRTAVGGSSKQFILRAGGGLIRMRTMTPREYARLQGVPDIFPITVDTNQALTGFGDAVCVPTISWISHHALDPLVEELN